MQLIKLCETLNPIINEGIFQVLHNNYPEIEWLTDENARQMDIDYYLMHSGEKYISRYYLNLLEQKEKGMISDPMLEIIETIKNFNLSNWNSIYKAYTSEYDPIANYDMTEKENVSSKITNKNTTGSEVYGFNSSLAVPTGNVTNESVTEGNKEDNERTLTRSGNIGVTTSAQMLEGEIKLRQYKFFNQVMNDIDKILCLQMY